MSIDARLAELGLVLPPSRPPAFSYVAVAREGHTAWVSGQLPWGADGSLRNVRSVLHELLNGLRLPALTVQHVAVMEKDSLDLTDADRSEISRLVELERPLREIAHPRRGHGGTHGSLRDRFILDGIGRSLHTCSGDAQLASHLFEFLRRQQAVREHPAATRRLGGRDGGGPWPVLRDSAGALFPAALE